MLCRRRLKDLMFLVYWNFAVLMWTTSIHGNRSNFSLRCIDSGESTVLRIDLEALLSFKLGACRLDILIILPFSSEIIKFPLSAISICLIYLCCHSGWSLLSHDPSGLVVKI